MGPEGGPGGGFVGGKSGLLGIPGPDGGTGGKVGETGLSDGVRGRSSPDPGGNGETSGPGVIA